MEHVNIYVLIAGMALVTFLIRIVPAFLMDRLRPGKRLKAFLELLPYTAMAALIIPGMFSVDAANPLFAPAGALLAALLAFKKCPVFLCVIAAVALNCLLYVFTG